MMRLLKRTIVWLGGSPVMAADDRDQGLRVVEGDSISGQLDCVV